MIVYLTGVIIEMKSVIYIFGGSGSGTTTLAKVISNEYTL